MEEERSYLIPKVEPLVPSRQTLELSSYNIKFIVLFTLSLSLSGFLYGYKQQTVQRSFLLIHFNLDMMQVRSLAQTSI